LKGLALKSDGVLEHVDWTFDDSEAGRHLASFDVSESAIAYVLEPVSFVGDIYVRDLFLLLGRNPALVDMFGRFYAFENLKEFKKGNDVPYSGEYDPMAIEYLELFTDWQKDIETGELHGTHRLWVRGVGYELREDFEIPGWGLCKKGTRPQWSILFSPVAQLLNLPLRVNGDASITDSARVNDTLHTFQVPRPTLGQVIHGFLSELSWAGSPEETAERSETLRDTIENAEMSGPMSLEMFPEWLQSNLPDK
jgi:hypothetical protein